MGQPAQNASQVISTPLVADHTIAPPAHPGTVEPTQATLFRQIRKRVRQAVHGLEPGAEIILYGSRSRGEGRSDSDWDFLILLDGPVDERRKDRIRHQLYEIEWDLGEELSAVIFSRKDWESDRYRALPFHHNVERDGLSL